MMYLDASSTTKPKDEVIQNILPYMKYMWHNPSSLYNDATSVKDKIKESRNTVADFINAKTEEIYFTSGSSESNNWAIRGWDDNFVNTNKTSHIITTRLEHKSIINAIHNSALHSEIHYVDNDNKGMIDLNSLEKLLWYCNGEPTLVCIIMANNEIGTIQHLKMIADCVHKHDGIFFTDATQAFGHIPIDVNNLGIDMMSASAHKIGGLKGTGLLYKKDGIDIKPLIYGSQESGLRGGTENVVGIIALAEAVRHCNTSIKNIECISEMRDYLIDELEKKFGCKLNGHRDYRLPNNINVTFPQNITGEALLYTLDINGCQISVGSACNSKSIEPSYVLKSIGLSDEEAMKTIRISLPNDVSIIDLHRFIIELKRAIKLIESEE